MVIHTPAQAWNNVNVGTCCDRTPPQSLQAQPQGMKEISQPSQWIMIYYCSLLCHPEDSHLNPATAIPTHLYKGLKIEMAMLQSPLTNHCIKLPDEPYFHHLELLHASRYHCEVESWVKMAATSLQHLIYAYTYIGSYDLQWPYDWDLHRLHIFTSCIPACLINRTEAAFADLLSHLLYAS